MTGDPAAHPAGEPRPAVAVRRLSKTFLGQRALRQVSFDVRPGEVHALLGENGSGKSTLIKCLAGYHEPDEGAIVEIDGRPMPLPYGPAEATAAGLLFVHQDLGLIPTLTVAENFAINRGFDTAPVGRIDWPGIRRRARAELAVLGHDVPVDRRVGRLPVAEQTIVAIARALAGAGRGARMLVLDEPTAALPDAETKRLLAAVRQVVANGVGVVYVSHKLHEILEIADRATVLLSHTPVGRYLYAIGGSREAARLSGVPVRGLTLAAFAGAGLLAGVAGIVQAGILGSGNPTVGPPLLLPAYAAAFLGATAIQPGVFNVWGTIIAVVTIQVGTTGLALVGAPFWIEPVFTGLALIVAVATARYLRGEAL